MPALITLHLCPWRRNQTHRTLTTTCQKERRWALRLQAAHEPRQQGLVCPSAMLYALRTMWNGEHHHHGPTGRGGGVR